MSALTFTPEFIAGLERRGFHEINIDQARQSLHAVVEECGCCALYVSLHGDTGYAQNTLVGEFDCEYEFTDLADVLEWESWREPKQ